VSRKVGVIWSLRRTPVISRAAAWSTACSRRRTTPTTPNKTYVQSPDIYWRTEESAVKQQLTINNW